MDKLYANIFEYVIKLCQMCLTVFIITLLRILCGKILKCVENARKIYKIKIKKCIISKKSITIDKIIYIKKLTQPFIIIKM